MDSAARIFIADAAREPRRALAAAMALLVLLCAGCAGREPVPTLADDPVFRAEMARARTKGARGITLVAPSSGVFPADLETTAAMAQKLGVNLPGDTFLPDAVPYHANEDAVRLALLSRALNDPGTDIVWAVRGGYGSGRLLTGLAKGRLPPRPKIFIGYSDSTFIHLFLHKHGWPTVHGSLFSELGRAHKDERNFRLLAAILSGRLPELRYDGLMPVNLAASERAAPVSGLLAGGNLACLAAAVGTPWFPDLAGKILFLEDVKEPGYKIDRMLTQLRLAGAFQGVRAVLLGGFTQGDAYTEFALERFAGECGLPVFRSDWFGHGERNYPLLLNTLAVIEPMEGGGFSLRMRTGVLWERR